MKKTRIGKHKLGKITIFSKKKVESETKVSFVCGYPDEDESKHKGRESEFTFMCDNSRDSADDYVDESVGEASPFIKLPNYDIGSLKSLSSLPSSEKAEEKKLDRADLIIELKIILTKIERFNIRAARVYSISAAQAKKLQYEKKAMNYLHNLVLNLIDIFEDPNTTSNLGYTARALKEMTIDGNVPQACRDYSKECIVVCDRLIDSYKISVHPPPPLPKPAAFTHNPDYTMMYKSADHRSELYGHEETRPRPFKTKSANNPVVKGVFLSSQGSMKSLKPSPIYFQKSEPFAIPQKSKMKKVFLSREGCRTEVKTNTSRRESEDSRGNVFSPHNEKKKKNIFSSSGSKNRARLSMKSESHPLGKAELPKDMLASSVKKPTVKPWANVTRGSLYSKYRGTKGEGDKPTQPIPHKIEYKSGKMCKNPSFSSLNSSDSNYH